MAEKKKRWIRSATEDKGALHRNLGVKEGEKIPEAKLRKAMESDDPKIRKEANLAATLKGFKKEPEGRKKATGKEMRHKMYGSKE